MFERFTDRARRVVVLAQDEARALNHGYIGTEHLLLACAAEGEGVAARALSAMRLREDTIRAALLRLVGEGNEAPRGHIPFTPRAKKILELALREALQLGHNYIGTEHILLGTIREAEGLACKIMLETDVDPAEVRRKVIEILAGYDKVDEDGRQKTVPMPGWEKVVPKPKPHSHIYPAPSELEEIGVGSVWRCNCGVRFTYHGMSTGRNGGTPVWQQLGKTDD